MSKYILAVGCSFTDKNYKSHRKDVTVDWDFWQDHIGDWLDLPVKTIAESGGSNQWMHDAVIEEIINNGDKIEYIIIAWSRENRYTTFHTSPNGANPSKHFSLGHRRSGYYKKFEHHINETVWDFWRDMGVLTFNNASQDQELLGKGWIWKSVAQQYVKQVWTIQELCKKYNIKYIMASMLAIKETGFDLKEDWIKYLEHIRKAPYIHDIDRDKYISFPPYREFGGRQIGVLDVDETITDKRTSDWPLDNHPNGKGHLKIANIIWKKMEKCYQLKKL